MNQLDHKLEISRGNASRAALLAAFNREIRQSSALGAMFNQIVAGQLGITSTDLECLDIIGLKGVMTAGQLADATGMTTGAVTGILDRLEKVGFARRERDAHDRRKVLVRPRQAAERRIRPYFASLAAAMDELMSRYTDAEVELLLDFASRSHAVMVDEITKLKDRPSGKTGKPRAARRK